MTTPEQRVKCAEALGWHPDPLNEGFWVKGDMKPRKDMYCTARPPDFTSMDACLLLCEHMAAKGWLCNLYNGIGKGWECAFTNDAGSQFGAAATASEAIVRAFLAAQQP